jgi:hypothetical protein
MLRHASRGEGTWVTDEHNIFVLEIFVDINYLIREASFRLKLYHCHDCRWELVSYLYYLFGLS